MGEPDCGWIDQELRGAGYRALLRGLRRRYAAYRRFKTCADVIAHFHTRGIPERDMDRLLRPLLKANREAVDQRIQTVLLAVFWPGLNSIRVKKHSWDPNPEDFWQNILCTFFEVTRRVDVAKRRERYIQKVYNSTVHHLYDRYRRMWKSSNHVQEVSEKVFELAAGSVGLDTDEIDHREAQCKKVEYYRRCLQEGWIKPDGFRLLVETRVHGRSLPKYARDLGISYEATKKRRQRAEASIRRGEGQ